MDYENNDINDCGVKPIMIRDLKLAPRDHEARAMYLIGKVRRMIIKILCVI